MRARFENRSFWASTFCRNLYIAVLLSHVLNANLICVTKLVQAPRIITSKSGIRYNMTAHDSGHSTRRPYTLGMS